MYSNIYNVQPIQYLIAVSRTSNTCNTQYTKPIIIMHNIYDQLITKLALHTHTQNIMPQIINLGHNPLMQ